MVINNYYEKIKELATNLKSKKEMKKLCYTILLLLPFIGVGQSNEDIQYYESGEVDYKYNFVDGKQHGEEIGYYESGEVAYKANYVDGKLQGELLQYNLNGEIEKNEN